MSETEIHGQQDMYSLLTDSNPKKSHSPPIFVDVTLPLITINFISFSVNMQVSHGMFHMNDYRITL
jgi:hypothetical protein